MEGPLRRTTDAVEEKEQERLAPRWAEWRRSDLTLAAIGAIVIGVIVIIGRFIPIGPVQRVFDNANWVTEQALRLSKDLFESYGYLTVFLAPLLENTVFLGAIIPSTIIMLLAGLSIHDGLIDFWPAMPLAIAGAIIGDTISYGIGRFGWQRLGPEARLVRWAERMRGPLMEHSVWLVLSYHFFGYSRVIGPPAAGFLRMPFLRWMALDYVGSALWVTVYIMAGYLLGVMGLSLDDSERNVEVFEALLFGLFIVGVIVIFRRATRGHRQRQETAPSAVEPAPSGDGARPAATAALDPADPPSEEETGQRVG